MGMATESSCLLVTVGTTKFDTLIEAILSEPVLKALIIAGYTEIRLQIGSAPETVREKARLLSSSLAHITLDVFDYKPSLELDIEWADLVISHAGAGTILDVLRGPMSVKGKLDRPALLIVSNDTLMNQHQSELVEELGELRVCAACSMRYNLHVQR